MLREKDTADYWSLAMPQQLADEVLRLHAALAVPTCCELGASRLLLPDTVHDVAGTRGLRTRRRVAS